MDDDEYRSRILTMARQCAVEDGDYAEAARLRGWLDEEDTPTETGRALIDELDGQDGARSVFRNVP